MSRTNGRFRFTAEQRLLRKKTGTVRGQLNKLWHGLYVDSGLSDDWLEAVNAIKGITVIGTCAGHGKREPLVFFIPKRQKRGKVRVPCELLIDSLVFPVWCPTEKKMALVARRRTDDVAYPLSRRKWLDRILEQLSDCYS